MERKIKQQRGRERGFNSSSQGKRNNTETFSASLSTKLWMSLCSSVCMWQLTWLAEPNHSTGEYHVQKVNWFIPLHRDLRRVYGYRIYMHDWLSPITWQENVTSREWPMTGDELVYSCHRDLRRVYGYHINVNLYVYKLSTNNRCANLWSNPFSYLFNGQTKERKECINV